MDEVVLIKLLEQVRSGAIDVRIAAAQLAAPLSEDLGFAVVDHHRGARRGFPEVVLGGVKTLEQVEAVVLSIIGRGDPALVTRLPSDHGEALRTRLGVGDYDPQSRTFSAPWPPPAPQWGPVAVVTAGTSDLPVAREAIRTLQLMGCRTDEVIDVGVAGIHRLFDKLPRLRAAVALVVAAGMEGALPSVVGGLVSAPVIAVPTSVGYGASFGGVSALLSMLNACVPGIGVVNIDNGFGAGYLAGIIARQRGTTT